jgi:ethanolamine utilization protein EutM
MSSNESLGFVETVGLVAAIEAADAMVKTAQVRVKTVCNADAALLSVVCAGDLAACKAAVDAGKAAAARVGDCVNSNLIARPDDGVDAFIDDNIGPLFEPPTVAGTAEKKTKKGKK